MEGRQGSFSLDNVSLPIVLAVAVSAVSSASILAVLSGVPGPTASFWRMLISTLILLPTVRGGSRLGSGFYYAVGAGIALGVHMSSWFQSLFYASVAASTTIVCTHAVFAALFMLPQGERPGISGVSGIAVSLIGVYLLSGGDPSTQPLGAILALIGAISGGVYFALGRMVRKTGMNVASYVVIAYFTASLVSLSFSLLLRFPVLGFSLESWFYILLLALIPNSVGHTLLNYSLRRAKASTVAGSVLGEPVGATILAILFLGQYPPLRVYLYMAIVLVGLWLTIRDELRYPEETV